MKLKFVSMFLFGVYFKFVVSGDCVSYYDGSWICTRNEDYNLNATYDCKLNNKKEKDIWIWSPAFDGGIDVVIVQNCEKVYLYTKFPLQDEFNRKDYIDLKNYFRYLHIFNVSLLSITNTLASSSETDSYRPSNYRRYYHNSRSCLLKHLIIENVQNIQINNFFHDCFSRNGEFKSLKLIHSNIEKLNIRDLKLEELIMKEVTIHEAEPDAFRLNGSGAIKITDSNFTKISNNFVIGSANEVVISNNSFGELYGKFFALEAGNITLNNNNIEVLPDDSLSFTSNNIQITDNIFHHIDQNAFRLISGTKLKFNISKSYNFSNNIIYSLAEGALSIPPENNNQKMFFDELVIANNVINCHCGNMYWFDSIAKKKNEVDQYRFYNKWVKNNYKNKCLNVANCSISQILKNYKELCSDDYDCSEDGQNDFMKSQQEHVLESFINYNVEMNQNISDLFQNVIDRIENKSLRNFKKDERIKNYFLTFFENFREKQKQISSLPYDNIMEVCLVFITILFCLTLIYFALAKFLKLPFFNVLTSKCGAKGSTVIIERDGNSSSVSELMSSI